jgi:hypothetical protein
MISRIETMRTWRKAQTDLALARIAHMNQILTDEELDGYIFRCEQARRKLDEERRAA